MQWLSLCHLSHTRLMTHSVLLYYIEPILTLLQSSGSQTWLTKRITCSGTLLAIQLRFGASTAEGTVDSLLEELKSHMQKITCLETNTEHSTDSLNQNLQDWGQTVLQTCLPGATVKSFQRAIWLLFRDCVMFLQVPSLGHFDRVTNLYQIILKWRL